MSRASPARNSKRSTASQPPQTSPTSKRRTKSNKPTAVPRPHFTDPARHHEHPDLFAEELRVVNCNPKLPHIYVAPSHPHAKHRNGVTYVQLLDFSDKGANISCQGQKMVTSHGASKTMFAYDLESLLLDIHDTLFLHDSSAKDSDPEKDICATWGFEIGDLSNNMSNRARDLQDDLVGDPQVTTMSKPTIWKFCTGSTALERNMHSVPIDGTERAIPLSISVENPKGGFHAPTAGNKCYVDEIDKGLARCKKYQTFTAEVATMDMQFGPPGLGALYTQYTDLMNAPPTGHPDNPGFTNQQSNLAAPVARQEIKVLSGFGVVHANVRDLSCLLSLSHFESRHIHPGLMILGLQPRGTQPTFDSEAVQLSRGDNVRLLSIMYMSSLVVSRQGSSALAALTGKKLLEIPSEFWNMCVGTPGAVVRAEHTTYAHDGISIMQAQSLAQYMMHELTNLSVFVAEQLPAHLGFCISRDKMLDAFTFIYPDTQTRTPVGLWLLGPGHAAGGQLHPHVDTENPPPFGNELRAEVLGKWDEHERAASRSIPLVSLAESTGSTDPDYAVNRPTLFSSKHSSTPLPPSLTACAYLINLHVNRSRSSSAGKHKLGDAGAPELAQSSSRKKPKLKETLLVSYSKQGHLHPQAAPFVAPPTTVPPPQQSSHAVSAVLPVEVKPSVFLDDSLNLLENTVVVE
ncbi:hypothetical protein DFH09DRAFT_1307000 [Mycena vulgaris]|nr:hypothetical protein DFH09DRAFT_1307000 [Mycena vulgaris]